MIPSIQLSRPIAASSRPADAGRSPSHDRNLLFGVVTYQNGFITLPQFRSAIDAAAGEFHDGWARLRVVLEDTCEKLTSRRILDDWPPDFVKPAPITLWKWLDRAVETRIDLRHPCQQRDAPESPATPNAKERPVSAKGLPMVMVASGVKLGKRGASPSPPV